MEKDLDLIRSKIKILKDYDDYEILYEKKMKELEVLKEEIKLYNEKYQYNQRSLYIGNDKVKYYDILRSLIKYKKHMDELEMKVNPDDTIDSLELNEIKLLESILDI
jgi:hypothetical protein